MDERLNKAQLLERIRADHAKLETSFAGLNKVQMTEGGLDGAWSVKDVLAHLTWWEQRMLQIMEKALRGERPQSLVAEGEDLETALNRMNAETYAANFERPLDEVLAEKRRSFEQVIALVESFTEDEVANPEALEQVLGRSLQDVIASDTYAHYAEHANAIQAWRNAQQ